MLDNPLYMRNSTKMDRDPFSDILQFANAHSVVSGGFTAGGAWALQFPPPDKIKFFGVVRGVCCLRLDGRQAPLRIEAGDVFLLSAPGAFVLASDMNVRPLQAAEVFAQHAGSIVPLGGGDDFFLIGGHVRLNPANAGLLAGVLPPLIHVPATAPEATVLHWLLRQMVHEYAAQLPGGSLASAQLAQLMFVQILRAHLQAGGPLGAGWLRAAADARIAPALRLMHGDPGHAWTLEALARACAMSRTSFALHFKTMAGIAPLGYLAQWRMQLAQRALREDGTPISVLSQWLGYTSESAFSHAFKRVTGQAPKHFRSLARDADAQGERGQTPYRRVPEAYLP
jgi:AraC-like DNA-binding protein